MSEVPKATNGGANQYRAKSTAVSIKQSSEEKTPEPNQNPTATFFADLFGEETPEDEQVNNSEVINESEEDPEDILDRIFADDEPDQERILNFVTTLIRSSKRKL